VSKGQALTGIDIVTAAATSAPLSAVVTAPGAYGQLRALVAVGVGDYTFTPWQADKAIAGATPVAMPVPTLDGASYDLTLIARPAADDVSGRMIQLVARKLAPGADLAAVSLPDPPALVEPAAAASLAIASAQFRVSQAVPHVRVHAFDFDDAGVFVISDADQIAFPDVSAVGIAAPASGRQLGWRVTSWDAASLSAVLGPGGHTGARSDRASIPAGASYTESASERRVLAVQ
jgi:hypothetical protein